MHQRINNEECRYPLPSTGIALHHSMVLFYWLSQNKPSQNIDISNLTGCSVRQWMSKDRFFFIKHEFKKINSLIRATFPASCITWSRNQWGEHRLAHEKLTPCEIECGGCKLWSVDLSEIDWFNPSGWVCAVGKTSWYQLIWRHRL